MGKHNITVAVRVRPCETGQGECESGVDAPVVSVSADDGAVVVSHPQGAHAFRYAQRVVLGSDQAGAHAAIAAELEERLWEGFSCTLVAYGQTGSGKTYTMFGPPGALTEAAIHQAGGAVPTAWGIVPRVLLGLLSHESMGVKVSASAVEIYQEHAFDLLANRAALALTSSSRPARSTPVTATFSAGAFTGNIHPSGCTCRQCFAARAKAPLEKLETSDSVVDAKAKSRNKGRSSKREMLGSSGGTESFATVGETVQELRDAASVARFARLIEQTRVAKSHNLNDRSSRSHCLVKVHITKLVGNGKVQKLQFLFVDLAGSERILKTGVSGMAEKEAIIINKSLTTLQRVIQALGTGSEFVPYRDSALTMLLRAAFGGASFTRVVINVSGDASHKDETLSSLQCGARIAVVRNTATVVTGMSAAQEGGEIEAELMMLRTKMAELEAAGHAGGIGPDVVPSHAKSLLDNMKRHQEYEMEALAARAQLAEAAGRGDGPGSAAHIAILRRTEAARAQADNLRDIILRQKSIKGLWVEPSAACKQTAAQVRHLEGLLQTLHLT